MIKIDTCNFLESEIHSLKLIEVIKQENHAHKMHVANSRNTRHLLILTGLSAWKSVSIVMS